MFISNSDRRALKSIALNKAHPEHWRAVARNLAALPKGIDVTGWVVTHTYCNADLVLNAAKKRIGVLFVDSWGRVHESKPVGRPLPAGDTRELLAFGPSMVSVEVNADWHDLGQLATIDSGWQVIC